MPFPATFESDTALASWLLSTPEGRAVADMVVVPWLEINGQFLEECIRREVVQRMERRARCLIVCHEDGLIEAYGDELIVDFADVRAGDEGFMEQSLPSKAKPLVMERSAIHWYDGSTTAIWPYIRDEIDLEQESQRLLKEVTRREALARLKYPNYKRLPEPAPF